ncbi:MAG: HD-GYP domain-containing protein [Clostridia bacterium]|nr:HD-GYP domain-containing protein [Clostridia bacterium]
MRYIKIAEAKEGMKIAEPIFNEDGSLELLSAGSVLNDRYINLIVRAGVDEIKIYEASDEPPVTQVPNSASLQANTVEKAAQMTGEEFDIRAFKTELEEMDEEDYGPVIKSVCNANMEIHVLTGEGNIPFDKKHEEMITKTKEVFEHLKTANDIDLDLIKGEIVNALPDMIRNNDVLMRLRQLEETDDYTFQHSIRVSMLATMIGKWLGYAEKQLIELAEAALLFDIGKMKIPGFIMNKPETVTEDEYEVLKRHAQFGYRVLMMTQGVTSNIKYSALQHHERMDGSGYPLRLRSGQIHEYAKIIMICDIFDAMTHDRPYKKKISPFKAAEYIAWQSGSSLDYKIAYVFLSNLAEYFVGKDVRLSNKQTGTIVYVDVNFPTRPLVKVADGFIDLVKDKEVFIEDFEG